MLTDEQRERLRAAVKAKSGDRTQDPSITYAQAAAEPPFSAPLVYSRSRGLPRWWMVAGGIALVLAGAAFLLSTGRDVTTQVVAADAASMTGRTVASPAPAVPRKDPFATFAAEVEALRTSTGCFGKITPASDGLGPLYGCIWGRAETAKLFVNGKAESAGTRSIKVIWNQWTKDAGYGLGPDRAQAAGFARAVAQRYAPDLRDDIVAAFLSNSEGEEVFRANGLIVTVAKSSGPSVREHLLTVEPDGM